jgi:hypothetical protein
MANVFEGQPDSRQSSNVQHPVSRFRPTYRALTDDEKKLHDEIKAKACELEKMIEQIKDGKPGRYKALAMTDLEKAIMWAVKELTS